MTSRRNESSFSQIDTQSKVGTLHGPRSPTVGQVVPYQQGIHDIPSPSPLVPAQTFDSDIPTSISDAVDAGYLYVSSSHSPLPEINWGAYFSPTTASTHQAKRPGYDLPAICSISSKLQAEGLALDVREAILVEREQRLFDLKNKNMKFQAAVCRLVDVLKCDRKNSLSEYASAIGESCMDDEWVESMEIEKFPEGRIAAEEERLCSGDSGSLPLDNDPQAYGETSSDMRSVAGNTSSSPPTPRSAASNTPIASDIAISHGNSRTGELLNRAEQHEAVISGFRRKLEKVEEKLLRLMPIIASIEKINQEVEAGGRQVSVNQATTTSSYAQISCAIATAEGHREEGVAECEGTIPNAQGVNHSISADNESEVAMLLRQAEVRSVKISTFTFDVENMEQKLAALEAWLEGHHSPTEYEATHGVLGCSAVVVVTDAETSRSRLTRMRLIQRP